MKSLIAAFLVIASAQFAHATDSAPNPFSFEAATAAFDKADVPTAADLTGNWNLTGVVDISAVDQTHDGYWPDGKVVLPGQSGYFYSDVVISAFTDAFGASSFVFNGKTVGAESGKTYWTNGPYTGAFGKNALVLEMPGSDSVCASTIECRMVRANGMLLCRTETSATDTSSQCPAYANLGPLGYSGYMHLNH